MMESAWGSVSSGSASASSGSGAVASGAFVAMLAVAAGAFGAHALKGRLSPDDLAIFETAARYQMYHALALIVTGLVPRCRGTACGRAAFWSFVAGIVLFSGSLYALVLSGERRWGAVTPLGGAAFMLGWLLLGISAIRRCRASDVRLPPRAARRADAHPAEPRP
ncbi:MAG: hypothetical protein CHACPFDD_02834 [Phycisphaerae bacterium]|nr:hypothetical protein [Phycisphaerae bacterium]